MPTITEQRTSSKPQSIKEIPNYIWGIIDSFFFRLFYTFRLVWEAKPSLLILTVGVAIFNGITPMFGSLIGAELLNKLAGAYSGEILTFSVITVLLMLQFGYSLFRNTVSRLYNTITSLSGDLVSNHIQRKIMNKSRTIDLSSFDQPEFYSRMENASREAGSRPIQILSSTFSVLSSVISMVSYTILLLTIKPYAPLFILIAAIPSAWISYHFRKKNVAFMVDNAKNRLRMEYYSTLLTSKNCIKETRMFRLEDILIEKYQSTFNKYYCGMKRLRWNECLWSFVSAISTSVVSMILYTIFARGVFDHKYAIGDFSLYTGAISAIGSGVMTLVGTTSSIYEGTLFINNLISFMNEETKIVASVTPPRPVTRNIGHTIEFENVSFRYPKTNHYVLKHVSFTIRSGETIMLVGLNGSGKTTLLKLMTRLYDPTEGQVLLDGHDIREYDIDELYSIYGMIFQDFARYAVTVRENITFGNTCIEEDIQSMISASAKSNADIFINKLPRKYETPLMRMFEDDGIEPSTGQWQKLAIARAFYRDAEILILDEPTASLDPLAERKIYNQFDQLRKDRTTIFVSHRLSSATVADQILVLRDGVIVEKGSHAELISSKGVYHHLFTTQADRFRDG